MGRQIVLLAGLHKTASSSIQATCVANFDRLREAGWIYPRRLGGGEDRGNHSGVIAALFRQEPARMGLQRQLDVREGEEQARGIERYRSTVIRRLESAPEVNLVMVAEAASTLTRPEMMHMKEWFTERGWQMRVMVHVRHVSKWLNSMVAQRVNGQLRMTIGAAVDELSRAGGLVRPRLENLRAVFPGLEVYSHELAVAHHRGPPGFFLEQLGVTMRPRWPVMRANDGRGDCATRTLSLLNWKFGLVDEAGRLNDRFLRDKSLQGGLQLPGAKFQLRAREAAPLVDMLREENEWLRREFGDSFHDPEIVLTEHACIWSDEALAAFGQALRMLPEEPREWVLAHAGELDLERQALAALVR